MMIKAMFKPIAIGAASAALLSASVQAQTPANPDPTAVQGGAYTLEPQHTQILFRISHMGFSAYYGEFAGASGSLTLHHGDPAADSLQVSIPVASVHTTSAKLDDELKSADWLDAGAYPAATFRSTRVVQTGPGQADVEGQFTLHGVTRPLSLHVQFNGAGVNPLSRAYTTGFEATGRFRRSAYGVSKYVPLVGDDVELIISGAFERAPS